MTTIIRLELAAILFCGFLAGQTTLVVVPSPFSTLGQAVTLTATVVPQVSTGVVTFYDGLVPLGVGLFTEGGGGAVSIRTTLLPAGSHSLIARFQGNGNGTPPPSLSLPVSHFVGSVLSAGYGGSVSYTTGNVAPSDIIQADFNNDGITDLATSNAGTGSAAGTVSVFLGTGNGSFQNAVSPAPAVGVNPRGLAFGDFNQDGNLDIMVANSADGTVGVLLGKGDGTFQPQTTLTVGSAPNFPVVGDFDGDGRADIMVSNSLSGTISVLLGNGDGTFQKEQTFAAGNNPAGIAQADFNNDGITDVAIANNTNPGTITILSGTGRGTFSPFRTVNVNAAPNRVAAARFSSSDIIDLVVSYNSGTAVTVLRPNSDGFFSGIDYTVGSSPSSIAVGDINADGKLDIVAANSAGSPFLSVLLGDGAGGFSSGQATNLSMNSSATPVAVVAGDFNGDGRTDVALADSAQKQVTVSLGLVPTTISLTNVPPAPNPSVYGQSVQFTAVISPSAATGTATFFVDGSAFDSIPVSEGQAQTSGGGFNAGAHSLTATYSGDAVFGASTTAVPVALTVNQAPSVTVLTASPNPSASGTSVTLTATVTAGASGSVNFYKNNTDGFVGSALLSGGNINTAAFAVPGLPVGQTSLFAVYTGDNNYIQSTSNTVTQAVLAATTTTLSSSANPSAAGQQVTLTASVTSTAAGAITGNVTFSDGTTILGSPVSLTAGSAVLPFTFQTAGPHSITAKYNGDPNFFASTSAVLTQKVAQPTTTTLTSVTPSAPIFGQVVTLTATVSPAPGTSPLGVTFYDGATVLGTGSLAGTTATFSTPLLSQGARSLRARYNGNPTSGSSLSSAVAKTVGSAQQSGFDAAVAYTVGSGTFSVAIGDFNGDGIQDIASTGTPSGLDVSGAVNVLFGNGNGTFQTAKPYAISTSAGVIAVADVNGDGHQDIVATTPIGVVVLLNTGTGAFGSPVSTQTSAAGTSLALADVNGDGLPDAVIGTASGVLFLPGVGDGTFGAAQTILATTVPSYVVAADFDNDGNADVAVIDATGNLNVLLGKGDGTFQPARLSTPGSQMHSIATGDFNGDGKADIALAAGTSTNSVVVLLGNGDGTFLAPVTYPVANGAYVSTGDFTGDGILDLAVADSSGASFKVLPGSANGTFGPAVSSPISAPASAIAVGNFLSGDGRGDIVVGFGPAGDIGVLLGTHSVVSVSCPPTGGQILSNVSYSLACSASGGLPPYTYSISAGTLPPPLTLNTATGAISGTPNSPGLYTFTLNAADSSVPPQNGTKAVTITVVGPLTLNSSPLPSVVVNTFYSISLVSGGTVPFTCSITSGTLPNGLSLNPATCVLSGTPTIAGVFSFGVGASDSGSPQQTAARVFSLTVSLPAGVVPTGVQPSGTTAVVLNKSGALVAVTSGAAAPVAAGTGCPSCTDVARDAAGNLIIASGTQLTRITSAGSVLSGGPIPAPTGSSFVSVAVDAGGNYIVADNALHQISRISPDGSSITKVASYPVVNGNARERAYVRVDASGNFVLAEDNSPFDAPTTMSLFRITPAGTVTSIPISPSGSVPVTPGGLTFDARGNYIIVDRARDIIFTITPAGASTPLFQDPNKYLSDPVGIYRDPVSGYFFLVDDVTNAMYAFAPDGSNFTQILAGGMLAAPVSVLVVNTVQPGTTGFVLQSNLSIVPIGAGSAISCPPATCTSNRFFDFAFDASGNFIVAANTNLVKITQAGVSSVIAGAPSGSQWISVAVDGSGNFIVADNLQHRIVKVSPTGTITPVASYTVAAGNQAEDVSVRIDGAGNYIVAEDNGGQVHIFRIAPAGTVTGVTVTGTIPAGVAGLTLDASGNYVLTDYVNAVVDVITPAGAGSVLFSNPNKTLVFPYGIYRSPAGGNFLLTDKTGNALYSLSPDGKQLTLVASQLSAPVAVLSLTLSITTTALPAGVQGQIYTATTLAAFGGSGNYTWTATGLPPGLSITTAGVVGGAPGSGSPAQSSVVVTVTDTTTGFTANKTFPLTISPPVIVPTPTPVTITPSTTSIPTTAGGSVSATFRPGGGTPPYAVTAVGLPPGVTIDSNGTLSGSPTQSGVFNVNVTVTDAQHISAAASFTINVLGLNLTALPGGTAGQFFSATLTAVGGTGPYSFSAAGLPSGLSLTSYGYLNGTVKTTGTYAITVTVTSGGLTVSGKFSVTIAAPRPLSIPGISLTDGTVNVFYSQSLSAAGGFPPFTWSLSSGSLPQGLSINASGTVSGTPGTAGSVTFGVQVTDAAGAAVTATATIAIHAAALVFTTRSLPSGVNGVDYPSQVLAASGGVSPYTWAVNSGSSLPPGLALSSSGVLSGIPTSAGSFSTAVTITDAAGTKTLVTLLLTIRPPGPDLILTYASLAFSLSIPATGPPAAQTVGVLSTDPTQKLGFSLSVSPAAPWLAITNGSATPDSLEFSITSAALALNPGDYQTTVTETCASASCAGHTQTISVDLNVTAASPKLLVETTLLAFSANIAAGGPISQSLYMQNAGGGSIGFASLTCEASWCTTGAPPASLAGGVEAAIPVTVDPTLLTPGFYRTLVDYTTSAGTGSVPVTLFIAPDGTMTLAPAGTQFNMPAGSAPGNAKGSFLVSVNNPTPVNWSAKVTSSLDIPGAGWLVVGTPGGTSSSTQPGTVSFSIDPVAAAALLPGAWYGRIEITSPDVSNAPQDFEVVLNVTPAAAPATPDPEPAGLLFITAAGGVLPPQTVTVYSGSKTSLPFQTSAAQNNKETGTTWLSVIPGTGGVSVNSPAVTTVSADISGLKPGIYHGGVSYSLSATAVRTVNVTLIVANGPVAAGTVAGSPASAPTALSRVYAPRAAGCTPALLAPAQTGLVNNFSAPAAWPTPLVIQLSNDCGSAVNNGQVVATFSNGDPPLALSLADPNRALYSGTWSPRQSTSQLAIVVRASAPGYKDATSQIEGAVVPNPAPLLTPHGTVHSFDPLVGGPLAPGTIVAIYGDHLAAQAAQPDAVPLPTGVNGTTVIVGGIEAPLYYVSPGQINAQIPFELQPARQYQVIVSANGALTTPDSIQLSPATPGIAAFADGGLIAQHGDGSLVSQASPAKAGEYLVAYLAGLGSTTVPLASGAASPGSPLALPTDPPVLTINGAEYPILFAGLTPGLVGLYQMNFQVPAGLPAGNVTLVVAQVGQSSNKTVLPYQP